ncbi:unnamed protein product [Zymoseptoria tritici ST99CH_1A5]|uniref:Uncharacterized protein n=1 Tax=Zymoseptoria tritici ST99CH_1A5 TaxID=1276529 RepID=A0A1Y6LF90_ZYMTR|nr:unnamed protein product [Zymoseptoria tritici ST99CH_1A5]
MPPGLDRNKKIVQKKETTWEKAQRDAESSGLIRCYERKLSKYEQQRNARWARAQAERKAKRFTGLLMRGVTDGPKQNVSLGYETRLNTQGELVEMPPYYGPAVLWVTLNEDKEWHPGYPYGGIDGGHASRDFVYRLWPETRKQPSQERRIEGYMNMKFTFTELRAQISSVALTAATFRLAEDHPDPEKSISRHEAELIVRFEECWNVGVNFLQHAQLLRHPSGDQPPVTWLEKQQAQGSGQYSWLVECFGRGCFPCPELVSIAAFYFCQRKNDLPEWLTEDSSKWVAWLFLFGQRLWRRHGDNKTRNTLTNLPVRDMEVAMTQAEVVEARDEFFNYINEEDVEPTTWLEMEQMSYISPIANQAVSPSVHLRNPRQMGPEHYRSPLYDANALAVHTATKVKTASEEEYGDEESDRMETETEAETDTDWGSCCSSSGESEDR